ncbi:SMI1/KNR4 family protein [Nonomuraea jiangxiensis]|uniref:SMI1 / KNR4 family (SUKH-1) n=1 Tax=Nonomuraea jiangxiensis TaxID=633440 RepID=A0A1G9QP79_9ACTN|nr:SMI1/KNR4 family protein [Nonomuraea jiangxiensis]SDM12796.1 SMI1 / KNR4 family (SUKH-1) [Nonomuraea jiangxiensis]
MNRTAWKSFLERWNEDLFTVPDMRPQSVLNKPVIDSWFGFPPASIEQVGAAEKRLGCTLPPSLREFLLTSDGWQRAGYFGGEVRGTGELGWLRDLEPSWVKALGSDEGTALMQRALLLSEAADDGVLFLAPGDADEHGEWAAYELFSWSDEGPERHGSFAELMDDLRAGFYALQYPQGRP